MAQSVSGWFPSHSWPAPPSNPQVITGYQPGVVDLRWDAPSLVSTNADWEILGVNIYRSDVSERGPYFRINVAPLGATYYRDQTETVLVPNEVIPWEGGWQFKGDAPNNREWVLNTSLPIVKQGAIQIGDTPVWADSPRDVTVTIDGEEAAVGRVFGKTGEITLINQPAWDPVTKKWCNAVLPTEDSVVEVTYYTSEGAFVPSGHLGQHSWYRFTTVASNDEDASAASMIIQDLTYTAVTAGEEGNDIGISYLDGGTAGSETVVVAGTHIIVTIESGVTTDTQIKAAIEADTDASELVTVSAATATAQVATTLTLLQKGSDGDLIETPLDRTPARSLEQKETLDYVWREAVRRNYWILQQGGERVKLFIRKQAGEACNCCRDPETLEYTKQPSSSCTGCYGTGFVGGYEGPYDIIVAPDNAERRITQTERGRTKEHSQEVWTHPSPLLTQRDFLVYQTNERYIIGPVTRPTSRGMILQQHFTIGYLNAGDIRYQVPIDGTTGYTYPETRWSHEPVPGAHPNSGLDPNYYPVGEDAINPMITEKSNIPDSREGRGRTPVWENTEY